MSYDSIRPGKEWLDTNGKPILAHGFSVFCNEGEKPVLRWWDGWKTEEFQSEKENGK